MRRIIIGGIALIVAACGSDAKTPWDAIPPGPAPDSFRVAFETTRGTFIVEAHRAWAPLGVDRLYGLVTSGFLDDNGFYRVVPKFVVQFGGNDKPAYNAHWDSLTIADDPQVEKNSRGTMAFATDGPGTRSHTLFINLKDNTHLDGAGFVPVGRVVDGMSVVDSIYPGYKEKPKYHYLATLGNSYLQRMFPKLDYIRTARIVP